MEAGHEFGDRYLLESGTWLHLPIPLTEKLGFRKHDGEKKLRARGGVYILHTNAKDETDT